MECFCVFAFDLFKDNLLDVDLACAIFLTLFHVLLLTKLRILFKNNKNLNSNFIWSYEFQKCNLQATLFDIIFDIIRIVSLLLSTIIRLLNVNFQNSEFLPVWWILVASEFFWVNFFMISKSDPTLPTPFTINCMISKSDPTHTFHYKL